ncbi:hypothetical protein KGF57_000950 [Candida theae]|uniref:Uncharacterized protein n=1 Tax=Candida theae TaxID=1198502 RepID=A0AAD5BHU1_9ASCO|nr:uncharacterized protein KGF57_000950 [Candida theae]KAI5964458.1 hypothetical protein KGF57_000950 [Candida theae]
MERVYTAVSISLFTNKRLAIYCDTQAHSINNFIEYILQPNGFNEGSYTVIDLLQYVTIEDILHQSTTTSSSSNRDGSLQFKNVIIWQNLQHLDNTRQKQLYQLILQIDNYGKSSSTNKNLPTTISTNNHVFKVIKPSLFTIIPFLEYGLYDYKIYPYLKEMFWSSVTFPTTTAYNKLVNLIPNYQSAILKSRCKMDTVFISPTIKSYIYSLIVFIRCHRLASLAPKSVRVPTATVSYMEDYCKSLVLWRRQLQSNRTSMTDTTVIDDEENVLEKTATAAVDLELEEEEAGLFVTPEYVKIAIRNIGYWLVDWETNRKFANTKDLKADAKISDTSNAQNETVLSNKKLEISMLTGDWYGSEYYCANEFLKSYKATRDDESPTGMTNRLVDDAIEEARPPL